MQQDQHTCGVPHFKKEKRLWEDRDQYLKKNSTLPKGANICGQNFKKTKKRNPNQNKTQKSLQVRSCFQISFPQNISVTSTICLDSWKPMLFRPWRRIVWMKHHWWQFGRKVAQFPTHGGAAQGDLRSRKVVVSWSGWGGELNVGNDAPKW